jgi:beta-glucosidase
MVSLNGGWTYTWQGEKTDEIADKFTILEALQKKWAKNVLYSKGVDLESSSDAEINKSN